MHRNPRVMLIRKVTSLDLMQREISFLISMYSTIESEMEEDSLVNKFTLNHLNTDFTLVYKNSDEE